MNSAGMGKLDDSKSFTRWRGFQLTSTNIVSVVGNNLRTATPLKVHSVQHLRDVYVREQLPTCLRHCSLCRLERAPTIPGFEIFPTGTLPFAFDLPRLVPIYIPGNSRDTSLFTYTMTVYLKSTSTILPWNLRRSFAFMTIQPRIILIPTPTMPLTRILPAPPHRTQTPPTLRTPPWTMSLTASQRPSTLLIHLFRLQKARVEGREGTIEQPAPQISANFITKERPAQFALLSVVSPPR